MWSITTMSSAYCMIDGLVDLVDPSLGVTKLAPASAFPRSAVYRLNNRAACFNPLLFRTLDEIIEGLVIMRTQVHW